ncbi:hypothetical protein VTO42DRAFT_3983 [Malbranchea cinnamomea]
MEVLHQPPQSTSFIPLAEHQSRTPASFYDGPPVLHHHSEKCKIVIYERELRACSALLGLREEKEKHDPTGANGTVAASSSTRADAEGMDEEEEDKEVVIDNVDVWVTSEKLILFSPVTSTGVSIPYPSVSLHAIQRLPLPGSPDEPPVQGLYMQLASQENAAEGMDEDEDEETVSLTIIPQPQAPGAQEQQPTTTTTTTESADPMEQEQEGPALSPTEALYTALSACSNLHPDLAAEGDEEDDGPQQQGLNGSILFQNGLISAGNNAGGLPPPMPGSGGWITAENVHEYFDEEGNWKGGNADADGDENGQGEEKGQGSGAEGQGPLGPGAGTVRSRDQSGEGDVNEENEETKWRRTG